MFCLENETFIPTRLLLITLSLTTLPLDHRSETAEIGEESIVFSSKVFPFERLDTRDVSETYYRAVPYAVSAPGIYLYRACSGLSPVIYDSIALAVEAYS